MVQSNTLRNAFFAIMTMSLLMAVPVANADTITPGFTFAVADSGGGVGTHFHSSTGGEFGNPAGKAEVGSYYGEDVRGLSEYNLAGLGTATSAFVTFKVFKQGGLFPGDNDWPFDGDIDIFAYQGNNTENFSDYQAASIGQVGTFNPVGHSVGDVFSFDLTTIFNDALSNSYSSLGIRLQIGPETITNGGAWTFDTFRLTNTDETHVVPEPATLLLLGSGLIGMFGLKKKKHLKS